MNFPTILHTLTALALLSGSIISTAYADDDEHHTTTARNTKWQTECGACHIAFPPRLLPAASWRVLMSGLDKHFGNDASVDAASAREISGFLEKNAGRKGTASDQPLLRITETRWFKHEHDDVSDRTWKNPKVKSPANCAACHTQADSGNYSERNIRIPK